MREKITINNIRDLITFEKFEIAFKKFIEQADMNETTGKSNGSKTPEGFSKDFICQGADFGQNFGQGAASKTPYMNWWVVSIYYVIDENNVKIAIEKDRYNRLKEMNPLRFEQIGKKQINVAMFYTCSGDNVDYRKLYEKFMDVCSKVISMERNASENSKKKWDQRRFYENRVLDYTLDKDSTWKKDTRELLADFYSILMRNDKHKYKIVTVSSGSNLVRIIDCNTNKGIIDFVGRKGKYISATYKTSIYKKLYEKNPRAEAKIHRDTVRVKLSLEELWNDLCVVFGKDEYKIK